jgi:hypothetical protein
MSIFSISIYISLSMHLSIFHSFSLYLSISVNSMRIAPTITLWCLFGRCWYRTR